MSTLEFYRNSFLDEQKENTRLRLILLWAAEHLSPERVTELIEKVKSDTVADMDEDDEEFRLKVAKAADRLTDVVADIMGGPLVDVPPELFAKLDEAANQLRGFLPDLETEGTLRKIRHLKPRSVK